MAKDDGKSAIDAVYEILNEIKSIKQEIVVINNNIKLLNNKLNKGTPTAGKPSAVLPVKGEVIRNPDKLVKVFGRIKNQNKKPMTNVHITVFSPRGEIVKSRNTDGEGYWEARLPPGQYSVELDASHINPRFKPQNINITVSEEMEELEVRKSE